VKNELALRLQLFKAARELHGSILRAGGTCGDEQDEGEEAGGALTSFRRTVTGGGGC
jgi:hypothetical protein